MIFSSQSQASEKYINFNTFNFWHELLSKCVVANQVVALRECNICLAFVAFRLSASMGFRSLEFFLT